MRANGTQFDKIRVEARRGIDDLPGYTISADGIPRKWNRRLPIHKGAGGLPVVDVDGVERLLDEIVATAFLGPPPAPLRGVTVVHFDGDDFNCAVDNLAWRIDREWLERRGDLQTMAWMRPDHLPVMIPRIPPNGMRPTKQQRMVFC
jgi:hypothetical protein